MTRPLYAIASEIHKYWEGVNYAAKPYLQAMHHLDAITEVYGFDSGRSIVLYFLGNAKAFKGEHARRIKTELKELLK